MRNIDKIAKVRSQVDEVAGLMRENINKTLERGEKVKQLSCFFLTHVLFVLLFHSFTLQRS